MGAFSSNYIDFTKGYPSMYAVDHSAEIANGVTIPGGSAIHLDENGQWQLGHAAGRLPYVTGHDQASGQLDSARGAGQMAGGGMGGVSLTNTVQFMTTQFTGGSGLAGKYVIGDTSTGKFREANENEQISGWCMRVLTNEYGDSVAEIVACVSPNVGGGYSSASTESVSSESA